ncbi:aspartyl-phosphate phosphatase Spo0E family protein [Sporosarcina ureilytica]|uniref:Spo0E family sporulation regulatory protein-aspartic acid phosphatase n=1 Tax=Sporosarcina ureilytica TaxID=298596 RepID=A0A1D8JI75_9BACL|nr:aspartyl-phosphate phosphatase Spo0E family protein [Sporosarcina ureilytica]AOV08415.1 hypothetical protein BI350_13310 [Sporosarcina ureilytica]
MKHNLMDEIEQLRETMIRTVKKKGFSSQETINLSRRLDVLLNELENDKAPLHGAMCELTIR